MIFLSSFIVERQIKLKFFKEKNKFDINYLIDIADKHTDELIQNSKYEDFFPEEEAK